MSAHPNKGRPEVGISIRLIRAYDPANEPKPGTSITDRAMILAAIDKREIPYGQKFSDALEFLKTRS